MLGMAILRRRLARSLWRMMWQGSVTELCVRWLWQLPQCYIGWFYALWIMVAHNVHDVRWGSYRGVTFLLVQNADSQSAVSLGFIIVMYVHHMPSDTESFDHYFHTHPICMHEFGHAVDSRLWGWLYLPVIGLPSLISAVRETVQKDYTHRTFWTERRANRLAARSLQSDGVMWNDFLFPRHLKRES